MIPKWSLETILGWCSPHAGNSCNVGDLAWVQWVQSEITVLAIQVSKIYRKLIRLVLGFDKTGSLWHLWLHSLCSAGLKQTSVNLCIHHLAHVYQWWLWPLTVAVAGCTLSKKVKLPCASLLDHLLEKKQKLFITVKTTYSIETRFT